MLLNAAFARNTRLAVLLGIPLALLIQTRCSSNENNQGSGTTSATGSTAATGSGGTSTGAGGSSTSSTGTAGGGSVTSSAATGGTGGTSGATTAGGNGGSGIGGSTAGTAGVAGKGGSGGAGGSAGTTGSGGAAGKPDAGGTGGAGGAGGGPVAGPCTTAPAATPPALTKGPAIGPFGAGAGQMVGVLGETTLYVIGHRNGNVYTVQDNMVAPMPLIHVNIATAGNNEQGLLSMVLNPDFANNHLFYLYYTAQADGAMTIDEFTRTTPTTAAFARNIYSHARADGSCTAGNCFHNGGTIFFNPKDTTPYLYFSIGNNTVMGQSAQANGFAGRILRIDLASKASTTYAYGLRNPYRTSIDRLTGDMWIGDVADGPGGSVFFLANGRMGQNFGYGAGGEIAGGISGLQGGSAALIGGVVYRGNKIPGLCGRYFFGMHDPGTVRSLIQENGQRVGAITNHATLNVPGKLTSFGEDGEGELYLASMDGNVIYKIVAGP